MGDPNTGESQPNDNTITLDEHQQKVEAAVKARLSKAEQEKQQLAAEKAQSEAEAAELRKQIAALANPKSNNITNEPNNTETAGLTAEDVAKLIDQKTQENLETKKQEERLNNVQNIIRDGMSDDKEFKELSLNNPDVLQAPHVFEVINGLGKKGLAALKTALKDPEARAKMHSFNEPGKLVAWASQFAHTKPLEKEDYNVPPSLDGGSGVNLDDELTEMIKNTRA